MCFVDELPTSASAGDEDLTPSSTTAVAAFKTVPFTVPVPDFAHVSEAASLPAQDPVDPVPAQDLSLCEASSSIAIMPSSIPPAHVSSTSSALVTPMIDIITMTPSSYLDSLDDLDMIAEGFAQELINFFSSLERSLNFIFRVGIRILAFS